MKQQLAQIFLWYIRTLAKIALRIHRPTIIGIAGSVGKSSTRNAIAAALEYTGAAHTVYGNSETGVPLGVLGITPHGYSMTDWLLMALRAPFGLLSLRGVKYLIVEMGIDDPEPPKNMGYLLTFVRPDIAISMNVGATHTMQFEKTLKPEERALPDAERRELLLDAIALEDTKIIRTSGARFGLYNADDPYVSRQMRVYQKPTTQTLFRFGSGEKVDAKLVSWSVAVDGTVFEIALRNTAVRQNRESADEASFQHEQITLSGYVLPSVYWENLAVALLVGQCLELDMNEVKQSLVAHFSLPKGRASAFEGVNDSLIIDSTYNASRIAMEPFLELLNHIGTAQGRERILVFGDMRELGESSKIEHEALVSRIEKSTDRVYCVGEMTQKYVVPQLQEHGVVKEIVWFETAEKLGRFLAGNLPARSVVLAKGSQNEIFLEEAVKAILARPEQGKELCRQEEYWLEIKAQYFARQRGE